MLGTPSQRRGLSLLLGILILILAIRLILNPTTVPDPQPAEGPRASELADRVDPNVASEAELAAIPGLGEKRAEAIVEFRRRFASRHPGRRAFDAASDLEEISGIGAATAEMMEPYLIFPPASTTRR
ncbi:MAG TPA: helix-hairpin-helix domain-containing protein [Tepidisphaeraceae bacterium]|nr:helix-hairpin-helix domain-containing protein [Tepidisphaeraceae bacterium]